MYPFDDFPEIVKNVLIKLETRDSRERSEGIERKIRLRQIPRDSGNFLFLNIFQLAKDCNKSLKGLEIGSSGGYSTIFQAMALKKLKDEGNKITTLEIDPVKVSLAFDNFKEADLMKVIEIIEMDAKKFCQNSIENGGKFDFFFLDAEKEDYLVYFGYIQQLAKPGSILFADNVLSHKEDLKGFVNKIELDKNNYCSIIPIGKGILKVIFQ
jgi:predicted O-methyltransferase YrrM